MSVTLRANAVPNAFDVTATDATTPQFFSQALSSLADRLGQTRFFVLIDDAGHETRIGAAQLRHWAALGPHGIEVAEIPYGSHQNFALLCDDLSSQHGQWRSLRQGELRISDAQYRQAYVSPARDSSGHIPRSTDFEIDVAPTAATRHRTYRGDLAAPPLLCHRRRMGTDRGATTSHQLVFAAHQARLRRGHWLSPHHYRLSPFHVT